jgi:hypothetical protein
MNLPASLPPVVEPDLSPLPGRQHLEGKSSHHFFAGLWIRIHHFSSIRIRIQAKTELSKTISLSNLFETKI